MLKVFEEEKMNVIKFNEVIDVGVRKVSLRVLLSNKTI